MENSPLVSVCLVLWNSARDLPTCLQSLQAQDYPNLEVIFVDNASSDASLQIARQFFPDAAFLCNAQNRGFCGGHNQGIQASHGAYYLPLNPDVDMEPGYISALVASLESRPGMGMAASRLYLGTRDTSPRRFDSTGLFIDRKRRQFLRGFDELDEGQYCQEEEVFGVDGAAPLYRRAMLEEIAVEGQYFDEAFHSHKEDVDLCWRARIMGWGCIYVPAAVAYHRRTFQPGRKRSQVGGEVKLHAVKNRYLLLIKNESSAGWRRDGLHILLYDLKILVYLLLFERSSFKAFVLLKQNWGRANRWRKQIRSHAKAAPAEQVRWFVSRKSI